MFLQERLLVVDMAPGHNMSVWDTEKGKVIAQTNVSF